MFKKVIYTERSLLRMTVTLQTKLNVLVKRTNTIFAYFEVKSIFVRL
jgi:hypothetical protein